MKRTQRALIAPLLLASASVAPAASILIDFGQTGQTTSGTGWNNFATSTAESNRFQNQTPLNNRPLLSNLINTDGDPTGVSLIWQGVTVGGVPGTSNNFSAGVAGGNYNTDVSASTGYAYSATRDYLFMNDGASDTSLQTIATLRLEGLTANGVYDLRFFAAVNSGNFTESFWSSGGQTVSIAPVGNTATVSLENLQADADGTIVFTWSNAASFGVDQTETAVWSTLEIVAIPEPSSAALMGAALAFGCFTRRRR